jgi:hypothetical protein
MGGTFIIVYHSVPSRITSGIVKGRFTLAGQVLDETGSPLPGALILVKNASRRATTNASGTFTLLLTELPVMLIVRFPGFDDKEVEITSENPVRIVLGERGSEEEGSAIDDIAAGTVIADFYLPYRCCSDCPPIQYIVPELNEPPAPGEGPRADAGADQVITLPTNTVTLNGGASTDPDGAITSWSWSMVNGPGTVKIGASGNKTTSVAGLVAGTYEFELKVTDNQGDSSTDTVKVIVNPSAEKSCSPLRDIIAEFGRFPNVDPNKFPAFRQIFQQYEQVQNYFKQLEGDKVADMPVDEQINWFSTPLGGQTINELLQKWLNQLNEIIQSNKDFRLLALNMYRILMLLAMYIMCIQKADFDKAKIPMAELFNMIRKHIADWSGQIREFAGEEVELVKKMGDDLRAEDLRINANGEASIKPKYLAMIRAILRIIDSI